MRIRPGIVVLALSPLVLCATATARSRPPSTAQRIAIVQKQVRQLSQSSFARGQRAKLLRFLSQSRAALQRHRACPAVAAIDDAHNLLLLRSTWRRRSPRIVTRSIAPSLNQAERALVGGAGRCAALSFSFSRRGSQRLGGRGFRPTPSFTVGNDQGDEKAPHARIGTFRPIRDRGPQVKLTPNPQFAGPGTASPSLDGRSGPFGPRTAGAPHARPADATTVQISRTSNLGVAPAAGGEPKEPTVAIGHNVAWYTGNTSADYSLDGGRTWQPAPINPSTILPDPPKNPLCCDQQVVYVPAQNLFVWILQYYCPTAQVPNPAPGAPLGSTVPSNDCLLVPGNNVIRFAVTTPEELRTQARAGNVGKAWHIVWDLTPQQLGEPANAWFDYSTVSVNDWFVNWTVDMYEGNHSAVAMRVNLASLAQYKFQSEYFFSNFHTAAAQEPPGTTRSYFAANNSYSQTRVWAWTANSTTPLVHDIDHASIPIYDYNIPGTDGIDWNARAAGGLTGQTLSAAWSKHSLIVANMMGRTECIDKCDTAVPRLHLVYPYPGVMLTRINTTDWNRPLFGDLWSQDFGISWPSLGVAQSGAIGISFLGASQNANPVAYAGFLDLRGNQDFTAISDPAAGPQPGVKKQPPATGYSGGTGDYYSLQPGGGYESFVMPYRSVDATVAGPSDNWHFAMYGHGVLQAPSPPGVSIQAPVSTTTFPAGTPVQFAARVSDAADSEIPADAIYWFVDGALTNHHGALITIPDLGVGTHTVTVTAVNSAGLTTSRSVTVTIVAPSPAAPTAQITSPVDGSGYTITGQDSQGGYIDLPIQAQASDPQGQPLTFRWDDSITDEGTTTVYNYVSRDLSPRLRLYEGEPDCGTAYHHLILTVSNGTEAVTASVEVRVINRQFCVR